METDVPLRGYGEEGTCAVTALMMDGALPPSLQVSSAAERGQKSQIALLAQVTHEFILKFLFSSAAATVSVRGEANRPITNKHTTLFSK